MKPLVLSVPVLLIIFSRGNTEPTRRTLSLCDFGKLANWEGLVRDPARDYNGQPAAKWEHSKFPTARSDRIPHDWTGFNCLDFALHSNKATDSEFMLILASEAPETDGPDYFDLRITIDWVGWREFTLLFDELSRSRQPAGFKKIDSISFAAEGWGNRPHPDSVLHIANLRLTHVDSPQISDAELLDMLDLERPGLEKVRTAVKAGNLRSGMHEFAQYLRRRDKPVWKWDWCARPRHDLRPGSVDTRQADRILEHDLPSVGVYHKFETEIDWNLNPIDYREWPWQLNRHPYWVTLGRAYWATGEEKYAQEFVHQILDWVESCPLPRHTSGNRSYTWRTIEAGIRAGQTWLEAYHLFLTSPSFTDEAITTMVKSLVEHARHLMRWPTAGNWLAMEANGLMHVGVMFPEFKEASEWQKTATDRLYVELDRQVYPDGAQIELSTGYHQVSLSNFITAWEIAHLNGVPMPTDYIAKTEKMYDYNLLTSMPGGYLPGLNDASRTNVRPYLEQALRFFPERKDYEWVATQGARGKKPSVGSVALPFSGQLIMRSGWERDDLYLLMDAGPFGYSHQHEDKLSFVIYAHGKYHLLDPGNYHYDASRWRRYVVSARAHNTIMVDGLEQHRRGTDRKQFVISKPLPNKWVAGENFDYVSGSYDQGYGLQNEVNVIHSRHVFFVKPEYWIITDFLEPADQRSHRYESIFHLDADSVEVDNLTKSVRTANKDSSNLTIMPLAEGNVRVQIVSGQEEPIVQGWAPAGGYEVRPVPTPIFEKQQSGATSFVYAFFPTPASAGCPIDRMERLACRSDAGVHAVAAAIVFTDGDIDYFAQTDKPGATVRFLDFETTGTATLVRLERNTVVKALLAGGTKLMRGGKVIPAEIQEISDLSDTETTHTF